MCLSFYFYLSVLVCVLVELHIVSCVHASVCGYASKLSSKVIACSCLQLFLLMLVRGPGSGESTRPPLITCATEDERVDLNPMFTQRTLDDFEDSASPFLYDESGHVTDWGLPNIK